MQNQELSHPKKKYWHWFDYGLAPTWSQPLANLQIPCPSCLWGNYSEQPCRRMGALKTVAFHIHAYIDFLFLGKGSSSLIWLLPRLASLKVVCKVPGLILFLNLAFSDCLSSESMLTGLSWYRWVFVEIGGMDESNFSSCICLLTLQYLNQIFFFEITLWNLSDKARLLHVE